MANTFTTQTLVDGSRNLVVHAYLESDGVAGELAGQILIDASTFTPAFTNCKVVRVDSNLDGFSAKLLWDATTDVGFLDLAAGDQVLDFSPVGGIPNNAGAGKTGDVLITTTGFTAAGDRGHVTIYLKKKDA